MINWNQFLFSLSGLYLLYYALNILFDLIRRSHPGEYLAADTPELYFSEDFKPVAVQQEDAEMPDGIDPMLILETVVPDEQEFPGSGVLECSGAVNLKDLFSLAREELISYTAGIAY